MCHKVIRIFHNLENCEICGGVTLHNFITMHSTNNINPTVLFNDAINNTQ